MRNPKDIIIKDTTLAEILRKHKHWVNADIDGWENMRADLSFANLCDVDLNGVNLRYADLSYADLHYADLSYADLSFANLHCANLRSASLRYANLNCANLNCAILFDVSLHEADLRYVKKMPYVPMVCPEECSFIGWKNVGDKIVKLEIPAEAKRSSATSRKCRCEFAKVLGIFELDGKPSCETKVINSNYQECVYELGKLVYPDSFDENRWNECSHGIHFFMQRQEAIDYCWEAV